MFNVIANGIAENVEDHLTNDEEEDAKAYVVKRPSILKCIHNKNDLHDGVDKQKDAAEQVQDDEHASGAGRAQASPALECEQRHSSGNDEHSQRAESKQPD